MSYLFISFFTYSLVTQLTIRRLFDLASQAQQDPSVLAAAQHLQGIVARADRTVAVAGIAGTKYLLERLHGYGGVPRRPLKGMTGGAGEVLWAHPHVVDLVKQEKKLALLVSE